MNVIPIFKEVSPNIYTLFRSSALSRLSQMCKPRDNKSFLRGVLLKSKSATKVWKFYGIWSKPPNHMPVW